MLNLDSSHSKLLMLTSDEIESLDIAYINLLSAVGLPGAETLDIPQCLMRIDNIADATRRYTQDGLRHFESDPAFYDHSLANFRLTALGTMLGKGLGIRYNYDRIHNPDHSNSQDIFIHGLLTGQRSGTCVSIPVMHVAIGRRLGYPMKLSLAKGHVFARWDSPTERLNLEANGEGAQCFSDDHYHSWPALISQDDIDSGRFLKSLEPAEELAVFFAARGHCLEDNGRLAEAVEAYGQAIKLVPAEPNYQYFLENLLGQIILNREAGFASIRTFSFLALNIPLTKHHTGRIHS
jgi:tetratricopeptide (TPR) repeat protein